MAAPAMMMTMSFVLLLLLGFIHAAPAPAPAPAPPGLVFHVGGPRGWRVPDANTSYGWWAMNNRFHVGDSPCADFKYGSGDSVLVVDREAFDGCNTTEPVAAFADGATTVRLGRPGFFCFISGDDGQRLVVRVMVHPAETSAAAAEPAPATSQPGHGGGSGSGSGSDARSGTPGATSSSAAAAAAAEVAAGGAALAAAAIGGLVGFVLMLQ